MRWLILLLLVGFFSCMDKNVKAISGRWVYEKTDSAAKPAITFNEKFFDNPDQFTDPNTGMSITFFENKSFTVTKIKDGAFEVYVSGGDFKLLENNSILYIQTNTGTENSFFVVELSKEIMKLRSGPGEGVMVFRKVY